MLDVTSTESDARQRVEHLFGAGSSIAIQFWRTNRASLGAGNISRITNDEIIGSLLIFSNQ